MKQNILQSMKELLREEIDTIVHAERELIVSVKEINRQSKEIYVSQEEDDKLYYLTLSLIDQRDLTHEQVNHKAELIKKYGYKELHEYTIDTLTEVYI